MQTMCCLVFGEKNTNVADQNIHKAPYSYVDFDKYYS